MGRYGQAILTIAGTIIGAYFGYPALGATLGSLAGGLLFPQQLPTISGPRLADITQTTSSVGTSIPRGWGTFPVPGTIIAKSDIREVITEEEVGGKGGPTQTVETATYYQDFAIGLADSEDPILGFDPVAGVRRIWANGKIIYDRRPQLDGETDSAFSQRIAMSDVLDEQMVIYTGTETQDPDPTLEAFYGAGNISAFRGLAYIVFINWQNKAEDGNRMPANWRFEVYTDGAIDTASNYEYANEVIYPWQDTCTEQDVRNPCNTHTYFVGVVEYPTLSAAFSAHSALYEATYGVPLVDFLIAWSPTGSGAPIPIIGCRYPGDLSTIYYRYNSLEFVTQIGNVGPPAGVGNGYKGTCSTWIQEQFDVGQLVYWGARNQDYPNPLADSATYDAGVFYLQCDGAPPLTPGAVEDANGCVGVTVCGGTTAVAKVTDRLVQVKRVPSPPPDPCNPTCTSTPPPLGTSHCIVGGQIRQSGAWEKQDGVTYKVMRSYAVDGGFTEYVSSTPLSPALPLGHADDTQAFWEYWYQIHVAYGTMPEGLSYGIDYPDQQSYGWRRLVSQTTIDVTPISIAGPIHDICRESGMAEIEIDVTDPDVVETQIIGYVRPRVMTGRAALEPLRMAGFIDGIESERTVKFVKRGKPVVLTLGEDELGTSVQGQEKPSKITTRKLMDFDLPRMVRVHYLSYARDYENGEQPSPVRTDTDAVNEQDVEIAIVMTDEDAVRIAQVLWADAWASRWVHEITIDSRYQRLQAADAIAVPVDGRVERMRIIKVTDMLPNDRRLEMVRDDDGNYVSYAVASEVPVVPPNMSLFGPVEGLLLDLPMLRDEDNDSGFYAATRALLSGNFKGATIHRSTDGGGNYTKIGQVGNEATIGIVTQPLAAGPTTIWDEGNELYVDLQSGSLENRTELAVMEGANAAAIGVDGRWEIVQFRNVELVVGTIYKLTGLLRGRRGTEHFVGTSESLDRFVLISGPGIIRVPLQLAGVGREYLYKVVGQGTTLDSAEVIEFTGRGVALKPFSPVNVEGSLSGGVWTITWLRRGRIGQTLQSGTDIPISEEREDYEVDILSVDGEVLRTISTSTESATYTENQQVVDFGSAQTTLTVVVYQISTSVGRGTGQEAIL